MGRRKWHARGRARLKAAGADDLQYGGEDRSALLAKVEAEDGEGQGGGQRDRGAGQRGERRLGGHREREQGRGARTQRSRARCGGGGGGGAPRRLGVGGGLDDCFDPCGRGGIGLGEREGGPAEGVGK
eukprot:scaffold58309_cov61-Phaeocystis_antarctica.AAC.1